MLVDRNMLKKATMHRKGLGSKCIVKNIALLKNWIFFLVTS